MAKISQLPTLTNINTGSIIPIVDNSVTQKITVGKLYEFLSGTLDVTFATEIELLQSASSITSSLNEFASASILSVAGKLSTSSFESYTSSNDTKVNTLINKTGSLATTGSNTFIGNQGISGSIFIGNDGGFGNHEIVNENGGLTIYNRGGGSLTLSSSYGQIYLINSPYGEVSLGNLSISGSNGIRFSTSSHIKFVNEEFEYGANNDIEIKAGNIRISSSMDNPNVGLHISGNTFITGFVQIGDIFNSWSSYIQSYGDVNVFGTSNLYGGINSPTINKFLETSSFEIYTQSIDSKWNTLGGQTGSFITEIETSSFAKNGSNRFNGNQIITGSIDLTGFPLTASFVRLNGGNGSNNEDNFHQIRFDYRYDSGSRELGAGGFSHFITTRHFPGVNSNNNALDVYLNNSVGQYSSTAWNTGSKLGVTITAAGIGVLKTNPNSALDINGNLIVSGTIISTLNSLISGSFQITNLGFATTSSNTFKASQTIDGNLFLSGSNRLLYNNSDVNSLLFGFFDGSSIYGPYYQIFGNNYSTVSQRGSAEFVYDTRNGGESGFNIASFNGTSWTRKLRVDDSGVFVSGTLVATTSISGSIQATNNVISSSTQISESGFVSSSTINVIQTITSASYAGITPVSGTLYIIIG